MMHKTDVAIIGGGPSGLWTASLLAGAGFQVTVLEKKPAIGKDVVCTGIVSQDVLKRIGIGSDSIVGELKQACLISPSGKSLEYCHPQAFAYILDREKFDRALALEVENRGGSIQAGLKVDRIKADDECVLIEGEKLDGEPFRQKAALAVLATGIDFKFHRQLGLGMPKEFLKGCQVETIAHTRVKPQIYFGGKLAPGTFAWVMPAGENRLRLGLLAKKQARAALIRLIARGFPESVTENITASIKKRPVAQGLVSPSFGNRIIAVGEAAGQVKTTTGGGIAYGILGAEIASSTIQECFRSGKLNAASLSGYETRAKKVLAREIAVGYYARQIYSRLSDSQLESLFLLALNDGIIPIIQARADFDWHSGLIVSLMERLSSLTFWRSLLARNMPKNFY